MNYRRLFGASQCHLPSRFLDEIPDDLLEKISQEKISAGFSLEDDESADGSVDDEFDQRPASEIIERAARYNSNKDSPYRRGIKVRHPVFGIGIVRASIGTSDQQKLTIAFQNGLIKKILAKYAELVVL